MWVGNKLLPELEGFCVFLFRSEGGVEAELGKQILCGVSCGTGC